MILDGARSSTSPVVPPDAELCFPGPDGVPNSRQPSTAVWSTIRQFAVDLLPSSTPATSTRTRVTHAGWQAFLGGSERVALAGSRASRRSSAGDWRWPSVTVSSAQKVAVAQAGGDHSLSALSPRGPVAAPF